MELLLEGLQQKHMNLNSLASCAVQLRASHPDCKPHHLAVQSHWRVC